jgi:hypothetical protein
VPRLRKAHKKSISGRCIPKKNRVLIALSLLPLVEVDAGLDHGINIQQDAAIISMAGTGLLMTWSQKVSREVSCWKAIFGASETP